jgi:hypothetical protein
MRTDVYDEREWSDEATYTAAGCAHALHPNITAEQCDQITELERDTGGSATDAYLGDPSPRS